MKRIPLVVGNWKMNHTATDAAAYAARLRPLLAPVAAALRPSVGRAPRAGSQGAPALEVAIAPPFPVLERLGRALDGTGVALAAQDCHEEPAGAFTGSVSAAMLEDAGCRYVLIGHSERRQREGESDARIARKLERLAGSSVRPILCVGETLAERDAGQLAAVLARQLAAPVAQLAARGVGAASDAAGDATGGGGPALVVAYEPVWAIGTGRVATPETAQAAHAEIRRLLTAGAGEAGKRVRILYGGSLKPGNARSLLEQPDVDGALVGGASLDPSDLASIVSTCFETQRERS